MFHTITWTFCDCHRLSDPIEIVPAASFPTKEWSVQPDLSDTPTSTPTSSAETVNKNILRLVSALGTEQRSVKELMTIVGLKDRENFLEYSLNPAITEGYVRLLYPDKPRQPQQKYLLTVKGQMLYEMSHNLCEA